MIGGFLGAGKTTALARLGQWLTDRGLRVGLITNDQSTGLVDTAMLRSRGFDVEEIAGGCFCCRFDSLLKAAEKLTAATHPDVFLAEPVGSCTDLAATVSYPLRRIYGDRFTIAPLSVLVDPIRASRIFGLETGRSFSPKVVYVYRKQLEEADYIIVNKIDAVTPSLRARLESALRSAYPQAELFSCSAREGAGLDDWFERVATFEYDRTPSMELDYVQYGEGEALLGWLNCTVRLGAAEPFDGNQLLLELAESIRTRVQSRQREIAHLKMTLDAQDGAGNLSVVNVVRSDSAPDIRESLLDRIDQGVLIVNLRAEAPPEELRDITETAVTALVDRPGGMRVRIEHMECFRPAQPKPTHRLVVST